jgi:PAS domain S-box-containing protein
MAGVTKAVEGITVWRLIWTGLLGAIAVTEVVVAAMSELLLGRVTVEYLTIGLVAAFVTSLVVLPLLSHFVIQVRTSRDILLRSRELILAEEKYREVAEQALRASEERYRRVSSVISDIAFSCRAADSGEYAIDWLTGATERITGYSPDELKAKGCWGSIVVEDDRARFDEHVAGLAPGSSGSCELQVRHKDGSVRWLASWVECVLLPDAPHTPRLYGGLVDITERKRAEGERVRLQHQLAQAQKMESVGRLAGGVAHDFNNLLTVINGYAGFLSKELAVRDPALREYALEIGKAGDRAASLTRQLLAFSRKQVIAPRAINLNGVVTDAERMLQRLIGDDIELVTRLAPHLGLVMADPDQIQQVIINLAVNARDAMPDGGHLEISTADVEVDTAMVAIHTDATAGHYVLVTVTDTGVGMTAAVLRNLFEPFFTTKERGKGTGLGLAMVYGILRQSNGWIDVQSDVGRGSTFHIYLPRIDSAAAVDEVKPAVTDPLRGKETVLIVEDQQAVRGLARKMLQERGYHVLEASDGREALSIVRRHSGEIDLLLTDVVMPGMDGRTLSEQLRELRPNLKVILMSGHSEDVITERGVLASGLMYIQKPFTPDGLAVKVREALGDGAIG